MGNRRFSGTTWALVGLSLVALYFVGTKVTPPPPAPPKEVTPAAATTAQPTPAQTQPQAQPAKTAQTAKADAEMSQARAERMKQIAADMKDKQKALATKKKFNATQIDVESVYWQQNRDGQAGVDHMNAQVEKSKEEENKATGPAVKASPGKLQPETPNSSTPGTAPK